MSASALLLRVPTNGFVCFDRVCGRCATGRRLRQLLQGGCVACETAHRPVIAIPCSSCRRLRSAAKQSPSVTHGGRCATGRRLRQLLHGGCVACETAHRPVIAIPCSSCRRLRSAAKQSPNFTHGGRCATGRRLRQLLQGGCVVGESADRPVIAIPCSSCRRLRSAAKQSPNVTHGDRCAPGRRLRQLLHGDVPAKPSIAR